MKLKSVIIALALVVSMGIFFTSCEDTGGPVVNKTTLKPISNLMANSGDNTINLKWDASPDTAKSAMIGYKIYVDDTYLSTIGVISKYRTDYSLNGIPSGTKKRIAIEAVSNDSNFIASNRVQITWASTTIFNEEFKVYESNALTGQGYGSGLQLFNTTANKPKTWTVHEVEDWTVGVYTMDQNNLIFGAANKLNNGESPYSKNTKSVMISQPFYYNSFVDWYDNKNFEDQSFTWSYTYDLSTIPSQYKQNSVIFVVREKIGSEYRYAKVLVNLRNGTFLQGTSPNRYFLMSVSYQTANELPYAKGK